MRITKNNLYKKNKCRFCGVAPNQKHHNCYHGFGDLIGTVDLEIQYEGDNK